MPHRVSPGPAQYDSLTIRRWSVEADADERSVKKELREPGSVRGRAGERIRGSSRRRPGMEGGLVTPADWARAYRALAAELERIAAERRVSHRDWLDQGASPLGRKRHCAAARRRVAAGKPDAAIVGRRHLLSSAALAEELGNISKPRAKPEPPKDIADELRAELRLVGGTH